jgi:hypothetical protein
VTLVVGSKTALLREEHKNTSFTGICEVTHEESPGRDLGRVWNQFTGVAHRCRVLPVTRVWPRPIDRETCEETAQCRDGRLEADALMAIPARRQPRRG